MAAACVQLRACAMRKARSSRQRNTGLLRDKASASVFWDAASEACLAAWTYALPAAYTSSRSRIRVATSRLLPHRCAAHRRVELRVRAIFSVESGEI